MSTYKNNIPLPFHSRIAAADNVVPYNGYAILGGAAADILGAFYAPFKCRIKRAGLLITETVAAATTAPVFHFDKEDAGTAPTSDGDVAIITVPNAMAAGYFVYDDYPMTTRINFEPGEWILVEMHTDAAHTATVAGKVIPFLIVEEVPEVADNITTMVETA